MFNTPIMKEIYQRYRIAPSTWYTIAADGTNGQSTAWVIQERYNSDYYSDLGKFKTLEEAKAALIFMEEQARNRK